MFLDQNIRIDKVDLSFYNIETSVTLSVLREDLIHPIISGNKFRKLKYNILEAKKLKAKTIITFGGAFSNHIAAVSYAGKINNLETIGFIRGEELAEKINENATLSFAKANGMKFVFIDRETYRNKDNKNYLQEISADYVDSYLIPEGGTNELAIKGCQEIITNQLKEFDVICCSIGTGGTFIGLLKGKFANQQLMGFPALKNAFFLNQIIQNYTSNVDYKLIHEYHFGGYAKITNELFNFVNLFNTKHNIYLDFIYTGKMAFGVIDLIKKNFFKSHSKILMIHTGGIQGNSAILNKQIHQK
ncbi:MAG: 1-aminocyclopropane-1-carboxylate deaminase/D-cysteine desulfhydrase [Solirubrobacteraceae bacterium]